ncbi:prepilin-type cleavage/methylation N-terminal domain protein [Peptoniphilus duerdenii ATCC BAA-1640]|uniref:Prepilin-type cleavage/methylation N-terminal domain protein n=1 Tax=Peptoniphilus duerdenii ATCC BAA-1640 TaxID=862517 RepID=E0NMY3_9FIRM|nr:type II secretion system protein [Peptoniphilus duerdenii]EFM24951.1 prepilin-type cleavage/methylation N-terminal domain protein [Peptoniphilus duerdenii ATCC BAA-1640]
MNKKNTKKSGFTLIELILVLSIISILISTAFYGIKNLGLFKEKHEIERIVDDIKSTRTLAMKMRDTTKLEFSSIGYKQYLGSELQFSYDFEVLNVISYPYQNKSFSFTKRGSPSYEGPGTLILGGKNKIYTITVAPVTGNVNMRVE